MFTLNWFFDAPAALVSKLTENPQLTPSRGSEPVVFEPELGSHLEVVQITGPNGGVV